jgi:hypothetical protein
MEIVQKPRGREPVFIAVDLLAYPLRSEPAADAQHLAAAICSGKLGLHLVEISCLTACSITHVTGCRLRSQ